jgi:hypothetical protein
MHAVKTKKSHLVAPRVERDAQFNWPMGSGHYIPKITKTEKIIMGILCFILFVSSVVVGSALFSLVTK